MYTSQDLDRARAAAKKSAVLSAALLALGIALLAYALVARIKPLAFGGLILPAMAAYFIFDVWCSPRLKYLRFVQDLLGGRSHHVRGVIRGVAGQARNSEEGVAVHDVTVRAEGEEMDTLFYWDDQRPLPQVDPQRLMAITAYGRYIILLEPI